MWTNNIIFDPVAPSLKLLNPFHTLVYADNLLLHSQMFFTIAIALFPFLNCYNISR